MGLRLKRRCFRGRVKNFGLLLASWTTPVTSEFWVLIFREEEDFDFQEEDGCMRNLKRERKTSGIFGREKGFFLAEIFGLKIIIFYFDSLFLG